MSTQWYYADAHNQQQGPVGADGIAAAYRTGAVRASTLVWREGLSGWVALSKVAAELGLPALVTPPPMPGAKVNIVKPASSSSATWVIVLVVVLFGGIFFVGILAAIAIPAYQDYIMRAKVIQAWTSLQAREPSVTEFYRSQHRCPANGDPGFLKMQDYSNESLSGLRFHGMDDGACEIVAEFSGLRAYPLQGKSIRAVMDARGSWTYQSDLAPKYLPPALR